MSEAAMWDALRPLLKGLDPVRVENPVGPGTPDVNYTGGWIELKYADRWPPQGGPLRVDHFTKGQRAWIVRRRKAGGRAWVLLKVGEAEWLLFEGITAALYLGDSTRERLYEIAAARWTRRPEKQEICSCLK